MLNAPQNAESKRRKSLENWRFYVYLCGEISERSLTVKFLIFIYY